MNEIFNFLDSFLRIYVDKETNTIIRVAICKTEVPKEDEIPVNLIIKIQTLVRMFLVRRRLKK